MSTILLIILLAIDSGIEFNFPVYIWVLTGLNIFRELLSYIVINSELLTRSIKENTDKDINKIER